MISIEEENKLELFANTQFKTFLDKGYIHLLTDEAKEFENRIEERETFKLSLFYLKNTNGTLFLLGETEILRFNKIDQKIMIFGKWRNLFRSHLKNTFATKTQTYLPALLRTLSLKL